MAKCTVMGGQQMCNQAYRPCNDGGVRKKENAFSSKTLIPGSQTLMSSIDTQSPLRASVSCRYSNDVIFTTI